MVYDGILLVMGLKKIDSGDWLRIGMGLTVVFIRLMSRMGQMGLIWGEVWLVVGWVIGDLMSEIDQLFYVAMCNPQELTCQRIRFEVSHRNFKNAWGLLQETRFERNRLPIHNVLTGVVVAVMGVWIVSSAGSALAFGVVVGLGIKLFVEFLFGDKKNWFWVFAREFTVGEVRVVGGIWGLLVLISLIGLIR